METSQTPYDSPDDGHVVPNELEELEADLVATEGTSTGATKRQFWVVQVRNVEGELKERPIRIRDIDSLANGEMIILPFDGHQPCGTDVDGLLGGFLGKLARNHKNLPISFEKWPDMPSNYKDFVFDKIIKRKFWWDSIHEDVAKLYMLKDIGKKWKENRLKLFNTYYDMTKSREENIRSPPKSILATEWASFIDYRLKDSTKQICRKNAENRTKLTINHTGGSKKLKRRRVEIMNQTGQPVSRVNLYIDTHKRTDGTYISEAARVVCEKIAEIENQGNASVQISPNDSLGQVFGKEHSGRVRGVGDGVCPSQVFGSTNPQFSAYSSSCVNSTEQNRVTQLENKVEDLTNELKAKDEKFKKIEMFLAQLFTNSSMAVPPDLVTSLGNIQPPGGHPSSQSDTDHS